MSKKQEESAIMVAAQSNSDADTVRDVLLQEFDGVFKSTNPDASVSDFESIRPRILILAFKSIDTAEQYYLRLFRGSALLSTWAHRAVLLCSIGDARRAYEQCRLGHIDDYVVFWPMTSDPCRLFMSVRLARLWMGRVATDEPSLGQLSAALRRTEDFEDLLDGRLQMGEARLTEADRQMRAAAEHVDRILQDLTSEMSQRGLSGAIEVKDSRLLLEQLNSVRTRVVGSALRDARHVLDPVRQWAIDLKEVATPQFELVKALKDAVVDVKPMILLVDDDELVRKTVVRLLASEKLAVVEASTAMEAFGLMKVRRPDLLIVDINMPNIDGLEMVKRVRFNKDLASFPIIMMTGIGDRDTVELSLKAGATDFIVKPVSANVLKKKIQLGLERSVRK